MGGGRKEEGRRDVTFQGRRGPSYLYLSIGIPRKNQIVLLQYGKAPAAVKHPGVHISDMSDWGSGGNCGEQYTHSVPFQAPHDTLPPSPSRPQTTCSLELLYHLIRLTMRRTGSGCCRAP